MELCSLAKSVFDDIFDAGGYVYIVGGSVRDDILNIHTKHDIDVEVYHLSYQQLYDVLSKHGIVNVFGQSFAIMQLSTLPHYDFALPRKEKKNGQKHQDFKVIIDSELPLEKAIQRRDLTMNALMYDYHNNKLIDLCGGVDDLQKKIIRCVNPDTFQEDPLRILRIAQFAARFDMSVEFHTQQLCCQMVKEGMLEHLSKERIYEEYCKILMSPKPSIGFEFLKEIKALPSFLEDLTRTHQRLDYHPEGDVFKHTMLVIDVAALCKQKVDQPLSFMWSCLLHDIGKPLVTTAEGHAPRHNEAGVEVFQHIDLIASKKHRQYIQTMIMYHMHLMNMARNHSRDISYLRLLKKIEGKVSLNDLIYISCCDKLGRGKVVQSQYNDFLEFIRDKKERLGDKAPLAIVNGYDLIELGVTEQNRFKDMLEEAYDLQLQGLDKERILRSLKKKYDKR